MDDQWLTCRIPVAVDTNWFTGETWNKRCIIVNERLLEYCFKCKFLISVGTADQCRPVGDQWMTNTDLPTPNGSGNQLVYRRTSWNMRYINVNERLFELCFKCKCLVSVGTADQWMTSS